MAADVIDLLSSSPQPELPSKSRQPLTTRASQTSQVGNHGGNVSAAGKSSGMASEGGHIELWSDDFESTIDLSEPVLVKVSGNKRQRLSPSPFGKGGSADGRWESEKENRSGPSDVLDITQLTSSAVVPASSVGLEAKLPLEGRASNNGFLLDEGLTLPSDPFASSPISNTYAPDIRSSRLPNLSKHGLAASQRVSPERDLTRSSSAPLVERQDLRKDMPAVLSDPFASSPPEVVSMTRSGRPSTTLPKGHSPRKRRDLEPISSSAPLESGLAPSPRGRSSKYSSAVIEIDSGSGSASESDSLPELADIDFSQPAPRPREPFRRTQSDMTGSKKRSQPSKGPSKTSEERARDRQARTAARERDKATKKRERERVKADKAKDKAREAALAEVNKMRTDKKVSTPEMIIDLPTTMSETLQTQLQTMLKEFGVQWDTWSSPVDNVVKWRRKVTSRFNDELGYWEPIPRDIQDEKHALVFMSADEFIHLVQEDGLEGHVSKMKSNFPGFQILYLLEAMNVWFRTNRNARNRAFTSAARTEEPPPSSQTNRRRRPVREYIDEEPIEDALLSLQVEHDVLIHHTNIPVETAQWITIFTQHISTVPYRRQRDQATLSAGFCMDSGQVRTGEDKQDTFVRMLDEVARVTAPIAYGVAMEFDSVTKLVNGLEAGGQMRLEGVNKCANKDGVVSDRTIGQAMSKRLWKVFTGRDETSTDV